MTRALFIVLLLLVSCGSSHSLEAQLLDYYKKRLPNQVTSVVCEKSRSRCELKTTQDLPSLFVTVSPLDTTTEVSGQDARKKKPSASPDSNVRWQLEDHYVTNYDIAALFLRMNNKEYQQLIVQCEHSAISIRPMTAVLCETSGADLGPIYVARNKSGGLTITSKKQLNLGALTSDVTSWLQNHKVQSVRTFCTKPLIPPKQTTQCKAAFQEHTLLVTATLQYDKTWEYSLPGNWFFADELEAHIISRWKSLGQQVTADCGARIFQKERGETFTCTVTDKSGNQKKESLLRLGRNFRLLETKE